MGLFRQGHSWTGVRAAIPSKTWRFTPAAKRYGPSAPRYDVVKTSGVSPVLFSILRVNPVLGRTFRPETDQDKPYGDQGDVVISYALWQRRFSGSPDVIGLSVRVEGRFSLQIIGVMPRAFSFPEGTDAWTNLPLLRPISPGERQVRYYNALGRLMPGKTLVDARAELAALSAQLEAEQPRSNAGWMSQVEPLADTATRGARAALLALLGAVTGVLLISCANVANLLLARASARRHEIAMRVALGAGTARLVRQCLTEAVVLATLGTIAGGILGTWISHALFRVAPPELSRAAEAGMNGPFLIFAICVGLATAALTGLAPALQAARADHSSVVRSPGRAVTPHGASLRWWLIAAEVAVVVVLLTSAALLMRSFAKLRGVDLGYETERVLIVETRWPTGRFATPSRRPWFLLQQAVDGMVAAVQTVPGVEAAGLMTDLPLTGHPSSGRMWRADAPGASGLKPPSSARDQWEADINIVTDGYFQALRIPFVRGRNFSEADRFTEEQLTNPGTPRASVAVINSVFASRYFPNEEAIGQTLVLFDDQTFGGTRTIVGIIADTRGRAVGEPGEPTIYLPHAQSPQVFRPTIAVRSSLPADVIAPAVRERLELFDPQLLVLRARPMNDVVSGALSRPRFNLLLVASFAAVALGLAGIGIYGVVTLLVTQRTREIGIRVALGALRADILRVVLVEGMSPVLIGAIAGVAGSLAVTSAIRSMLFGVTRLDPLSFAVAPVVLAAVALLACYLPARVALRVDPLVALREE